MDTYEKKYKESLALMVDCIPDEDGYVHVRPQDIFPELKGSGDEKIRKTLIDFFQDWRKNRSHCWGISVPEILTWLEKQGNPTDDDMKEALRTEYEKGRADTIAQMQKEWSEEDENGLGDALWCCKQAASIAKDENDMGNVWYAEHWLKSLKDRCSWKPSSELDETSYQVGIKRVLENPESYGLTKYNWKPSDEQMNALSVAVKHGQTDDPDALKKLLEQLKKLKGE